MKVPASPAYISQIARTHNQRGVDGNQVLGRTKEGFWVVLRLVMVLGGWRGLTPLWSSPLQNPLARHTSHNQPPNLK